MHVLVTGATGFVGRALTEALAKRPGTRVRAAVRTPEAGLPGAVETVVVGELSGKTDWSAALDGVDAVIHTAAMAHQRHDLPTESDYRRVNTEATLALAHQAAGAGVRHFVFLSTIAVYGLSASRAPLRETTPTAPHTPYARSKLAAEQGLVPLAEHAGMDWTILRPPLIYGPGAPGNLGRLAQWVAGGRPLPLGAVDNRRSLLGRDNLVDLLMHCLDHPGARNRCLLAADPGSLSTAQLVRALAQGMGRTARLWSVPVGLLRAGLTLVGRRALYEQLCGDLELDTAELRRCLDWSPLVPLAQGLREAGAYWSTDRGGPAVPTDAPVERQ